ncbi:MAG: ABC-type transport auxiliary lipoprotein family protein [Candidatus Polarisedimenticolia bacterium]
MILRTGLLTASIIALASLACAKIPPTHYYTLQIRQDGSTAASPDLTGQGLSIGVLTFEVDPPYDQDRIVYRQSQSSPEVGFYAYHRWAAPLSRMLPRVVSEGLQGTAGITLVEPASSGRDYSGVLEGRVLEIEEIGGPSAPRARMRLSLTLRLKDAGVVWKTILEAEANSPASTVGGIVDTLNAALSSSLDRARVGLAAALASRTESP